MSNKYKTVIITVSKSDHPYIEEWYKWHKSIGFTDIYIADNNAEEDKYDFDLEGLHIIPYRFQFIHGMSADNQVNAINMLYKEYIINNYDYCTCIDIDEFIDLRGNFSDINELIKKEIENKNKTILYMPWMYYGAKYIYEKELPTNSVVANYNKPLGYDYKPEFGRLFSTAEYKSLFKVTPDVKFGSPRFIHNPIGRSYGGFHNPWCIEHSKVQLRHYRTKCLETFIKNKLVKQKFSKNVYAWNDLRYMYSLYVFINGKSKNLLKQYNKLCDKYKIPEYKL